MTRSNTIEEMFHLIDTIDLWQLLSSSSSPSCPSWKRRLQKKNRSIPKFAKTLIIINRHAEATPFHVHHGKWERCHQEQRCLVLLEWVDKCYMSVSCLKTLCMISLSSGPTEITAGDELRGRLSQQTAAREASAVMESCNLESNELSVTSVSLSERRRRDGLRQEMLMLYSKLMHLQKWFQQLTKYNEKERQLLLNL